MGLISDYFCHHRNNTVTVPPFPTCILFHPSYFLIKVLQLFFVKCFIPFKSRNLKETDGLKETFFDVR
jgi:hypothetical protein